mgnify:FL=1
MPKPIEIGPTNLRWLRENHRKTTYSDMSDRIGVCVDTLKRILVREGLQEFDGAKYQLRRDVGVAMWNRPCLECSNEELRPKNWFYCRTCRKKRGYEEE